MSDIQQPVNPVAEASEPTTDTTTQQPEATSTEGVAPVEESHPEVNGGASEPQETTALPTEEKVEATLVAEKTIKPVTEGQLTYKGPGLIKSLVPSKKEFWLSDSPVTAQHMDLYMRGEKPEVSHPVVAWASHTGKGLLFFNKKGETERTRPHSVLPLYEATDLKKAATHEITFELSGHKHTLKAANDAERDGWYMSLERAMEMGKADKETVRASEGYQTEMEKLNKPNMVAGGVAAAGAAAAARSKSQPKKSVEADEPRRTGSDFDEEADKKKPKGRSASRGMLNKLKGKKEETEAKREEKKEEKAEAKEEKKAEKEEAKEEKKAEKTGEAAPLVGGATLDAPGTAERVMGAPVEEPAAESSPVTDAATKPEEKAVRPSKRNSIFGRMGSGWGSMKSPIKEKEMKDAELKPDVPPKDAGVSDTAPQIPDPSTEATDAAAVPAVEATEPESEGKSPEAAKEQLDTVSPSTQQKGFLSGLPFMNKRNRSVSPSTNMKEAPVKKEETPVVPAKDEAAVEPIAAATEEPVQPVTETSPATDAADKSIEEPAKTETTSPTTGNKRQSMLGGLGRRASKAFKGFQSPRKENTAPVATEAKEDAAEDSPAAADKPTVNGETSAPQAEQQQNSIGDVVPEAVSVGQHQESTPTITASA